MLYHWAIPPASLAFLFGACVLFISVPFSSHHIPTVYPGPGSDLLSPCLSILMQNRGMHHHSSVDYETFAVVWDLTHDSWPTYTSPFDSCWFWKTKHNDKAYLFYLSNCFKIVLDCFYFMCRVFAYTHIFVYYRPAVPREAKRETVVIDDCEPQCGCWEPNPS